jgi:hypothetical protein
MMRRGGSAPPNEILTRLSEGDHAMDCCIATTYALLSMSDIDRDDFIFGQLLTLATGLSLVVIARLLAMLLFAW